MLKQYLVLLESVNRENVGAHPFPLDVLMPFLVLWHQGLVTMVTTMLDLEAEMCSWGSEEVLAGGGTNTPVAGWSPTFQHLSPILGKRLKHQV